MRHYLILGTALALSALCAGALGACGGNDGPSTAGLRQRLLPSSELPGLKLERRFDWDNPIDFAVEGVHLPQETRPSQAVDAFEDAGFQAGVGESYVAAQGSPFEGPHALVDVVEFRADEDAREALDFVRKQGLKQPCFGVCSVQPREFAVDGIPGAKGVQLIPLRDPSPGAPPPFESYGIGFTVGPRLYLVSADGGPGQVEKSQVTSAAKALYERNAKSDSAS